MSDPAALPAYVEGLPAAGTFSLWAGPLDGPAAVTHAAEETHYAASTMKLPLMVAAYRAAETGRLDLDTPVPVHNEFASAKDGSPFTMDETEDSDPEPWRRTGTDVALRWLVNRSIVRSSNLATNLVLEHVGVTAVQQVLARAGVRRMVVARGIEDAAAREAGMDNLVTAADLATLLQRLAAGDLAGSESTQEMLAVLRAQQLRDRIPAGLPAGTPVAHKTGSVEGVGHDAGIVYPPDTSPYVFVMCTSADLTEEELSALIAGGSAAAWQDREMLGQTGPVAR